ncbi:hypothetical protein DE146DRAFT_735040 [Phaeosphaeria sp. MPI-PUGE-AT-0046c]|nr:hypothetical protein DE146DRAFT_735040 [Phaeosphaeria sp. MPI-PUGE-AT-0046c]
MFSLYANMVNLCRSDLLSRKKDIYEDGSWKCSTFPGRMSGHMVRYLAVISLLPAFETSALNVRISVSTYEPRPYTVAANETLIKQARLKAGDFCSSDTGSTPAWLDGPLASDVASFAQWWADQYDWTTTQAVINANFSYFYTIVPPQSTNYTEPVDLQFIHQQSSRDDAIPIPFLHGWPSTSLE